MDEPRTRKEKKGKDKDYTKGIYNQKTIRLKEALAEKISNQNRVVKSKK
jgi:hypothetical protein